MEFKVFGPLEIVSDAGRPIEIGLPSHRQTLTVLLLLHGDRPLTRDRLVEALWGDAPPGNPEIALRNRVHRLRIAMAGHERLETHPGGYRLRVLPGELDSDNFAALAAHGRAAIEDGDPQGATRLLQQALDLWREPPWVDLPATPVMQAVADRLDERRRDVQEVLIDGRLALGHHRAVIAGLRDIVSADPLREHAWAQLMLALYGCGLKAEALAAYTRARLVTVQEYGQDPSPEVEDLHRRILADDPGLASPARPRVSMTAAGQPSWTPVCQLPAAPADFTGRLAETETLAHPLAGPGVAITIITGPAGVGKSTLALHAGHLARCSFPDGQLYAHLGGCAQPRDPQDALAEILRSLGVPPPRVPAAGPEREALHRSMLAHRRVLLVIDDASTAAQVRPLLPGTAGSAVLVTSRASLADLEAAQLIELGEMAPGEAATLLGKIAGPAKATAEDAAVAAIAAACGHLPLALRIAGARLASDPSLTPAALARALADDGRRLNELAIGDLSVSARLDSAYEALGERDRRAFRFASLHPTGDIPGWLIPVLLADPGADGAAEAIARAGLITAVPPPSEGAGRYRMHVLTRAYAAARIAGEDPPELVAAASRRLLAGWLEAADHASRQLPRHPYVPAPPPVPGAGVALPGVCAATETKALAWFTAERANLTTLTLNAAASSYARAAELADRQFASQCQLANWDDGIRLWESIAGAALQAGDTLAVAHARYRLAAMTLIDDGRNRQAAHMLDSCLITFHLARDERARAATLHLLALCALADDDPARAPPRAEEGLKAARRVDDPRLVFLNLAALGAVLAGLGSTAEGVACCEEALAIASGTGEPAYEALTRRTLAQARIPGDPFAGMWGRRSRAAGDIRPA